MTTRTYPRLSIEDFGRQLLESGDLDPVYIALTSMVKSGAFGTSSDQWVKVGAVSYPMLDRWLLSYWCLYHCGAASYLAQFEGDAYWNNLFAAAANSCCPVDGRWPRGHERRHWRGDNAIKAYEHLRHRHVHPEQVVEFLCAGSCRGPLPFKEVAERARTYVSVGPWLAFKQADMLDRVLGVPVDFNISALLMFDAPRKAAEELWDSRMGANAHPLSGKSKAEVVANWVVNMFGAYKAPPFGDRTINLQEAETILCKYASHLHGHYPLNNDITEINQGLEPWARVSPLAQAFGEAMPR